MIGFLNPAFLWALPVALAPLLLLWRHRPAPPPTMAFAATHLLRPAAQRATRQTRVRQSLLLAVRIGLLAAAVLAWAGPRMEVRSPRSKVQSPGSKVRSPRSKAQGPKSKVEGPGASAATVVGIRARSREFLDAALGPTSTEGGSRLIFPDATTTWAADQDWVRAVGIRTGAVTVAAGPYHFPPLAVFDQPGQGDLRAVRVWRWWHLEPRGNSMVIARFSNGDPFLVEHWTPTGKTILCAVPADSTWSDLPLHPNFVPLTQELVRYLASPPPQTGKRAGATPAADLGGRDLSRWLLGLAVVLAAAEMVLSGVSLGKIAAAAVLSLALLHPTFSRWWSQLRPAPLVIIADRTDSMQFRADALANLLARMPHGETRTLTGNETALGEALLALTNRPAVRVILLSDGQHNKGVSPVWAAAVLHAPVFTVAVGDVGRPRDVSIAALAATALVFTDEEAVVRATVTTSDYANAELAARIELEGRTILATNTAPGHLCLRFTPPRTGIYSLRLAPLPGEATTANNERPFAVTFVPDKIRVFLRHEQPDWEYRHVRHALKRDPAVALVAASAEADVVLATTGQTWRLEAQGDEVFQQYWSDRVRAEFQRARHLTVLAPPPVSAEMYALGRNDPLLEEIARVSGGEFFTASNVGSLPNAVRWHPSRKHQPFDLRDSWLALLVVAAGFIVSWAILKEVRP